MKISEKTIVTLELQQVTPIKAVITLADPKDGYDLLDLKSLLVNGELINTSIARGTKILEAISNLQDVITDALANEEQ